jgi:hypothetical protein
MVILAKQRGSLLLVEAIRRVQMKKRETGEGIADVIVFGRNQFILVLILVS